MFSDKDLERLIDYRRENPGSLPLGWQGMFDNLIARLQAAERAVHEVSCLLDHPAFTVGAKSYDCLPQGMAARARSAREAVDVWLKVTGKYQ